MFGLFRDEEKFLKLLNYTSNGILQEFIRLYELYDEAKKEEKNNNSSQHYYICYNSKKEKDQIIKCRNDILNYLFSLNKEYNFLGYIDKTSYSKVIVELKKILDTVRILSKINLVQD